jgi:hypothetical protein
LTPDTPPLAYSCPPLALSLAALDPVLHRGRNDNNWQRLEVSTGTWSLAPPKHGPRERAVFALRSSQAGRGGRPKGEAVLPAAEWPWVCWVLAERRRKQPVVLRAVKAWCRFGASCLFWLCQLHIRCALAPGLLLCQRQILTLNHGHRPSVAATCAHTLRRNNCHWSDSLMDLGAASTRVERCLTAISSAIRKHS